jgi:hypothetical protein
MRGKKPQIQEKTSFKTQTQEKTSFERTTQKHGVDIVTQNNILHALQDIIDIHDTYYTNGNTFADMKIALTSRDYEIMLAISFPLPTCTQVVESPS